jgi:hypothetical protein
MALLGGPASNDAYQTVFSTWAIQHGQLACAFPAGYKVTAPLYPLASGAIASLERIGNAVAFPPRGTLGPHCDRAFTAINQWSLRTGALHHTIQIGYFGWLVLLAGLVAVLRACGRGRCGWEPTTLVIVACLPPVWMCLEDSFHPEDLFAMGFALASLACARRSLWAAAGVLVALAVLSQQYALLVAAPLLIVAPPARRLTYGGAAALTTALLVVPLTVVSSGGAAHAVLFGTGATGGVGGTILWELDLHGTLLLFASRVAPIILSVALAWWVVRRLGRAVLEPIPLLSLVTVSLGLRLVFEQQLWGYYFMALSVTLILLDAVRGHIRASVVAWLSTVTMVYLLLPTSINSLQPVEHTLSDLAPVAVLTLAILLIWRDLRRGARNWWLAYWISMIVATFIAWNTTDVVGQPPIWLWQVTLVPLGIALAAGPLLGEVWHCTASDHVLPTTGSHSRDSSHASSNRPAFSLPSARRAPQKAAMASSGPPSEKSRHGR